MINARRVAKYNVEDERYTPSGEAYLYCIEEAIAVEIFVWTLFWDSWRTG